MQSESQETSFEMDSGLDSSADINGTGTSPNSDERACFSKRKRSSSSHSLSDFVVATSKAKKEELDMLLATMIAACNLPFVFVEHESVKTFLNALRPGYKPPNRRQISESLIPELYDQVRKKVENDLRNQPVTFALDGWQNIKKDPLVCATIHLDNGQSYLTSAIDTSGIQQTAEEMLSLGWF